MVRGVSEQLGRLQIEDVYGVSACRPLLHPSREGWALVSADRYIVAWEWRSSLRRVLVGHANPVQAMVFDDNGSTLFSTDGVEFIAWSGESFHERLRATRRVVGVGKVFERRNIWQMCCLGGGRLIATTEGPALTVGRGTAHGHVLRVWDPSRGFKMLTEHSFQLHEAPPDNPVQLLSLPGTFDAMAVTPWTIVSFRHDSVLDINERDPIMADAGERESSMMRRWHVQCSQGDEFVGATAGSNNSVVLLSAAGVLMTIDNLKGLEVRRETLGSEGPLPYTSCHVSGALVSIGKLSGGISIFDQGRGRHLSPICHIIMDPYAQRNVVGRSSEQKHLADAVTVVPQFKGGSMALPGVVALAVSEANKACVTLTEDLSVRIIDVNNRRVSAALWAHHGEVVCLAVVGKPLGSTMVISGARDELLVLWDIARRHEASSSSDNRQGGAGVSSVGDRWGGGAGARGGMHGIGGSSSAADDDRDNAQAPWHETLSLAEGKSVDLAALVHPSLSFCRKFRRRPANQDFVHGGSRRVEGTDGTAASRLSIGTMPGVRRGADDGSMSAVCLAVHPERTSVAAGTAAGKLIILALPSGAMVYEKSLCETGVMGLGFGPSGRWLVVRGGSGWVAVLDATCGYRRVCVVQDVEGGWAGGVGGGDAGVVGEGYWPRWAHEVICVGESLCASAAAHLNSSVLHVITRASLRALAVYRINALSAEVIMLHRIELSGMPAHIAPHPSGHYVLILDRDEGRISENAARRPGVQRSSIAADAATGRVKMLHLMSGRFKGSFSLPRGTGTITLDPSGLFVASVQCQGGGLEWGSSHGGGYDGENASHGMRGGSIAGRSAVSIWCGMSGDLRAELGGLPADVTQISFLPDSSALVVGVRGGQLLVLGMPRNLRAEAKRVLFGREEGMHGMTLQVSISVSSLSMFCLSLCFCRGLCVCCCVCIFVCLQL